MPNVKYDAHFKRTYEFAFRYISIIILKNAWFYRMGVVVSGRCPSIRAMKIVETDYVCFPLSCHRVCRLLKLYMHTKITCGTGCMLQVASWHEQDVQENVRKTPGNSPVQDVLLG